MKSIKPILFSAVLFFSPLFILNCSHSSGDAIVKANSVVPVANAHPGAGNIAVVGDSLARGYGSTKDQVTVSGCLEAHFPGTVENSAVNGATTADLLPRLGVTLQTKPKLIFVSSGGNDAIHDYYASQSVSGYTSYAEKDTMIQMGEVFDESLAEGALVVYLGLNPPLPGSQRLPKISDLARSKGVIVVDGMAGNWANAQLMYDQFHPNDVGYQIMCDRIVKAIEPYYP